MQMQMSYVSLIFNLWYVSLGRNRTLMYPHRIGERAFKEVVISDSGLGKDVGKCIFLCGCEASDRWDVASVWKDCKNAQ